MTIAALRKFFTSMDFLVLLGLLIVTYLPLISVTNPPALFLIKLFTLYLLWVGVFYLTNRVLLPGLLYRNRTGSFAVIIVVILSFACLFNYELDRFVDLPNWLSKYGRANKYGQPINYFLVGNLGVLVTTMLFIGTAVVSTFTKKIQADKFKEQALENQRLDAELTSLKSQINPHFFFNVLNTIYGLTDVDTAKAKESIYSLSHMMRYVLYETKHEVTTLAKEISFIENYNKLMSLRLLPNVQVVFDFPATIRNVEIAPMLFLPFVENAFKHGINNVLPSFVYIGISQENETLWFEVRNSNFAEKANEMEESNGIGLANTRRRLELLYPDHYELIVNDDQDIREFTVQLKLFLS